MSFWKNKNAENGWEQIERDKQRKRKLKEKKQEKKLMETKILIKTVDLEKKMREVILSKDIIPILIGIISLILAIVSFNDTLLENIISFRQGVRKLGFMDLIQLLFIGLLVIYGIVILKGKRKSISIKFVNNLICEQYSEEEYTAIFIIKYVFDNIPKVLVFQSERWNNSYFLPYCHYDELLDEYTLKENLKVALAELLEINKQDFELYDDFKKNEYIAIKRNVSHNSDSKINYKFYYVKFINPGIRYKLLSGHSKSFFWKSKYELDNDSMTKFNNHDVLEIIDENALIGQSKSAFKESFLPSYDLTFGYRIIWNLTDVCDFSCPICATNSRKGIVFSKDDGDKEFDRKKEILVNLATINNFIEKIDFSGGDPLREEFDRKIIKLAKKLLPNVDITVTTTGKGMGDLSATELIETAQKCDITYDTPYEICNSKLAMYRPYEYNFSNFRMLERIRNTGIDIIPNIHVPILPSIEIEHIRLILKDINSIAPSTVKFIRFMPVGRAINTLKVNNGTGATSTNSGTSTTNHLLVDVNKKIIDVMTEVEKTIKRENYNLNVEYNCSLGVCKSKNGITERNCQMLSRKLGIDCNGRVYACIWAAYITEYSCGDNYKMNPFYLGDLTQETMYEILVKPATIKLLKKLETMKEGCRVCAFVEYLGKNGQVNITNKDDMVQKMLETSDPLGTF